MTEHKHLRRTVFAAYCLLMVYLLFLQRGRAPLIGGGGGGRPNMAQAGGKLPEKAEEAIASVRKILEEQLKK